MNAWERSLTPGYDLESLEHRENIRDMYDEVYRSTKPAPGPRRADMSWKAWTGWAKELGEDPEALVCHFCEVLWVECPCEWVVLVWEVP